jgi:hypothetical protein
MTGVVTDARFGLRALKTNPPLVALAVLCLGIGIVPAVRVSRIEPSALLRR